MIALIMVRWFFPDKLLAGKDWQVSLAVLVAITCEYFLQIPESTVQS